MTPQAHIGKESIRRSGSTPTSRAGLTDLPERYRQEAVLRLRAAAFVYAAAWIANLSLAHILNPEIPLPWDQAGLAHHLALIAIIASLSMFGLTWAALTDRMRAQTVLCYGLVFEVVGAFLILCLHYWNPIQPGPPEGGITWACVWIILFPLLVPTTMSRSIAASLTAASMGPLLLVWGAARGNPWPGMATALQMVIPEYICAVMAILPVYLFQKLGREVSRAKDMGSYRLVERLGQGGMGEVWRAEHRMLARPAAVKLLRPEALGADSPTSAQVVLRRFEREAQATARLSSPHTIRLFDFGVAKDGRCYYVMELLDGLDLESLIRRHGPVPAERALSILLQVCDSLAEAHEHGLIHRDVKPANVYICRMGLDLDFVKVLDFGLVKSREESLLDTRLTAEGLASGTPAYLAPEVAQGSQAINCRIDVYALGCVAYWLLTGNLVFEAATPMEMAVHHARQKPVPPSQRTEMEIPPEFEQIIMDCLDKEPSQRPQTMDALARRLRAVPVVRPWTEARARRWWEIHMPQVARPEAPEPPSVLLETSEIGEVRP